MANVEAIGNLEKKGEYFREVTVSSFKGAVDKAIEIEKQQRQAHPEMTSHPLDVLMDLDDTYIPTLDRVWKRKEKKEERMAALRNLLSHHEPDAIVVWTARPKIVAKVMARGGVMQEIRTVAEECGVTLKEISGLKDKFTSQEEMHREMVPLLQKVSANEAKRVYVFGNSRREKRGARWLSQNAEVTLFNIKKRA